MPDETIPDVQRLAPDQLLTHFEKTTFWRWVIVAVVLHVVVIAATSMGYLRDQFDPEGAALRKVEREKAAQAAVAAATPAVSSATTAPADNASTTQPAQASDEQMMQQRGDAPVVQRITEAAKPGEIPDKPDDLGLTIEDTVKR